MTQLVTTTYHGEVLVLPWCAGVPLSEALEWYTDLITAHDGTDAPIKVRNAPRQSFELLVPVPASDAALAFNLVYGGLTRKWAVPAWQQAQEVGPILAGATSITAQVDLAEFRDESLAILWNSANDWEIVEIASVGSGVLNLLSPVVSAYGLVNLVPVRVGRVTPTAGRQVGPSHAELRLHFEADDNHELSVATPLQFQGYDLYYECPLFTDSRGITDQISTRADVIDADLGVIKEFAPWTFNRKTRPYRTVLQGAAAAWEYREWLHRRAGRYRPFWAPTFEDDFTLLSSGALTTTISVTDDGFSELADNRSHIAVEVAGGTILPREILSYTQPSEGVVTLTLNESLGINATSVERICYLGLMRLDTDRVELQWNGDGICVSEVPVIEVSP